jgi:microcystin-dependent protein
MADPYLGEIRIISWNFPPKGWAFCDGQLLPINQEQALFSLLGTTYGGNGTTNFALPNLQGKVPAHFGNGIIQGQTGGEVNHTLQPSEMPAHSHVPQGNSGAPNAGSATNNAWASNVANPYSSSAPNVAMGASAIDPAGGSQAHTNMQPYLVLNFIIALQGIFPSRN